MFKSEKAGRDYLTDFFTFSLFRFFTFYESDYSKSFASESFG